ncbi:hypothetical protein A9Q89_03760 [Gammaproteobacteria bacterium 53_120_T64]|nr:hypothetical protein A9Q89_03760 [Gammaproteobacteria bacterium 53_120_T64]
MNNLTTLRVYGINTLLMGAALGILAGCQDLSPKQKEQTSSFADCQQQVLQLDAHASEQQSAAKYHASALLAQRCIGADAVASADNQRLSALAILNFIRAGDFAAAQQSMTQMQSQYPGQDLYLADGSSVVDSLDLLINHSVLPNSRIKQMNISRSLDAELNRKSYWLSH